MQSGATRMRQRDDTLPPDRPRSEHEPRPTAPGPHFAHDFTRVPVQAKLKVNTPGDSYEQEADRVADDLSKKSSCSCAGKCSSCSSKRVQRKSGAPTAESADVDPILNRPGHALDSSTRSFMEPYFGHDFSRVRVHSDTHAEASAESLGARAYTVGHHLVFGPGQYRPRTDEGKRLLAHELTHVMQQSAAGPMIQRDDKPQAADPPKKKEITSGPASSSPKLITKEAAAQRKPCACLVFMHHDEQNARHAAEAMHAVCSYNLVMVEPRGSSRPIDIPNVGERDPNEMFPRHIFRECVEDESRCKNFINDEKNKKSTKKGVTQEYVQRQFFLEIKKCSKGFSLPIVALHTNVVSDTAAYHKQRKAIPTELAKKDLDETKRKEYEKKKAALEKIKGKTFVDTPPEGGTLPPNTLLYSELEEALKAFPELVKEKADPTWKKKIESHKKGQLLSGGMTNILKWCQAHDNSRCYIGDPDHPDNVVWVTREEDFKKLEGTSANVVLQTRVTPGESETDLSSMFVGSLHDDVLDRMKREQAGAKPAAPPTGGGLMGFIARLEQALERVQVAMTKEEEIIKKREGVRFVNIETGQDTKSPAERLGSYRTVKSVLQPLGLHCCDEKADEKVEKGVESGTKPTLDEPKKEEPSGTSK